ncbi:MAG: starch-binding protein, partial [Lachnospiraceae bacterium]|nr:starch-binding protein [Lachnospiraceae bacterium]
MNSYQVVRRNGKNIITKKGRGFLKKYVKHTAFAVATAGLVATALALPNDIGKPNAEQATQQTVAKQSTTKDIVLHYRWDGKDTPHVYYENVNGSGEKAISYPGIPMKNTKDGWYTYTIKNAKSADIIFSIGDTYETATLARTAGEWWFDQDTWYACNPTDEKEQTTKYATASKKSTAKKVNADTLYPNKTVNDGEGSFRKKDVTTIAEDGSVKVGLSKITSAKEYVDTYVVAQDLSAAEDASIIIHYYTGGSEVPNIYYWNGLPVDQETVWPGQPMTYEDENWYQYTFKDTNKINFLFTVGMNQSKDLTCKKGEWWYKDGKLYSKKPGNNGGSDNNGGSETVEPSEKSDFREESIYFLMTTRFYDGDKSNNVHCWDENAKTDPNDPAWRGDFKGLIEKLDYIKALGFSAVWITPVVENASGLDYHGYHAMNFQKVDERYLSDGVSYQTLINEVHKRGMKIVQD